MQKNKKSWDTEDYVRCASLQILIGSIIFLFIYYFCDIFSPMESAVRTTIECIEASFSPPPWVSFVSNVSLKFLCQVCLLCGIWRHVTLETECIYLSEGFSLASAISHAVLGMCSWRDLLCWSLRFILFCSLEGHTWQAHGERKCGERKVMFCIQETRSHLEVAVFPVCA